MWGKFAFSGTGCILFAEFLVLFSDWMLGMSWTILLVHAVTVAVLALGLSGLSVGLGACLPNFREADPSKIAVSFGGTLNLVAGLFFLIVVIGAMAAPFHLLQASRNWSSSAILGGRAWPGFGLVSGVLAVVVPLRAGARNLRAMEF